MVFCDNQNQKELSKHIVYKLFSAFVSGQQKYMVSIGNKTLYTGLSVAVHILFSDLHHVGDGGMFFKVQCRWVVSYFLPFPVTVTGSV